MHLAIVTTYPPSRATLCEYAEHLVDALLTKLELAHISILADELVEHQSELSVVLENQNRVTVHRCWKFNDATNALKIQKKLNDLKPDVVLFNLQFASFGNKRFAAALGLLGPALVRQAGRRPTITLLHNLMETVDLHKAGFGNHPISECLTRSAGNIFTQALLKSDLLATTMPRYVDLLREKYRAKNIFLAPHGSFHRTVAPPLPEGRVVMTFGKFGTYKTVDVLLEAHEILLQKDPKICLVIAGGNSPNAPGYLEEMQAKYAYLPNVHFTGYVAEQEVAGVFKNCSVVAFPYNSTTGSSGVLHQAGEYARAAVMPRIGDLADLVEDEGYRAEFFEPNNAQSLADALWRVVEHPEQAKALGLANHAASNGLLLTDVADWYVLHFQKLLQLQKQNSQPTPVRLNKQGRNREH